MTDSNTVTDLFRTLAKVLLRSFVLGYLLLLVWAGLYIFAGEALYRIGGKLYGGLSQHDVDMVNYCGIATVKCVLILFFLFPYIAIRWVLRDRN